MRRSLLPAMTAALALAVPGAAHATMRSPHLETSCPSGYSYGEDTFEAWRVEGCMKTVTPLAGETKRVKFKNSLEINGMLAEPDPSKGVVATKYETESGSTTHHYGKVHSDDIQLILDPKIGQVRRRFVLYDGALDLVVQGPSQVAAPIHGITHAAGGIGTTDDVTLPRTGTPTIFGLRLRESPVATVTRDTGMTFTASLSLGSLANHLLRDWTGDVDVTLTEGQGMSVSGLRFKIPSIPLVGIGGLKNLDITYSSSRDLWSGGVDLDLSDLVGTFHLAAEVNASTGVPNSIGLSGSNLNIPLGNTGILLQDVGIDLGFSPLGFGANIGVSAGPQVAGAALITADGDIDVDLEPSFRLEAAGNARVLPVGNGQFARGDMSFVYDADGLIAVSGDVSAEASVLGLGVAASIGGSGAYSTTSKRFNVEAHATGDLLLGDFGRIPVVRVQAAFSSNGWAACTHVVFVNIGVGQEWNHGLELIGCDLSDFSAPVAGAVLRGAAVSSRKFTVAPGTKVMALHVTADRPGPRVRLKTPAGGVRLVTTTDQHGQVDAGAAVFSQPGSPGQYVFVRTPQAGEWTVEWPSAASQPQVVGLTTARDAPPVQATATVERRRGDRPGRRRLKVKRTGALLPGEQLVVGIQTPRGFLPIGAGSSAAGFEEQFDEAGLGSRRIVARVIRRGIPLPGREAAIGNYTATLPSRPSALKTSCRRGVLSIAARQAKGAEAPDAWLYVLRASRGRMLAVTGKPGKVRRVRVPRRLRRVVVTARPVVHRRALKGSVRRKVTRVC